LKKAKTNKVNRPKVSQKTRYDGIVKVLGFLFKWYYKIKYRISRPKPNMVNGMMEAHLTDQYKVGKYYQALIKQGKRPFDARRAVEKKFRIRILTK
jgi:hypothetical protein